MAEIFPLPIVCLSRCVFLQSLPVAATMVAGELLLLPLSAVMLTVYSIPGVRPLRASDSELPATSSSALWPSADT